MTKVILAILATLEAFGAVQAPHTHLEVRKAVVNSSSNGIVTVLTGGQIYEFYGEVTTPTCLLVFDDKGTEELFDDEIVDVIE